MAAMLIPRRRQPAQPRPTAFNSERQVFLRSESTTPGVVPGSRERPTAGRGGSAGPRFVGELLHRPAFAGRIGARRTQLRPPPNTPRTRGGKDEHSALHQARVVAMAEC